MTETSRVTDPENKNVAYVSRIRNGSFEDLRETRSSTGEVFPDPENEMNTVETITIHRTIGVKTTF